MSAVENIINLIMSNISYYKRIHFFDDDFVSRINNRRLCLCFEVKT